MSVTRKIVVIIDNVTGDIAGPITLHAHEASAIRFFSDVASMPDTMVSRHINDHDLVQLGELDGETLTITPTHQILLTGKQWAATQQEHQSGDGATAHNERSSRQ